MIKNFAYEASVAFSYEKRSKMYEKYIDVSIAGKKVAIGHKILQRFWLVQKAGRIGA